MLPPSPSSWIKNVQPYSNEILEKMLLLSCLPNYGNDPILKFLRKCSEMWLQRSFKRCVFVSSVLEEFFKFLFQKMGRPVNFWSFQISIQHTVLRRYEPTISWTWVSIFYDQSRDLAQNQSTIGKRYQYTFNQDWS